MNEKEISSLLKDRLNKLLKRIEEAQINETNRLIKLNNSSDPEKSELEKRFQLERETEKTCIERLKSEYDELKQNIKSGEVNSSLIRQKVCDDRFHGLETYEDLLRFREINYKFENADRINQMNKAARQMLTNDKNKLKLLLVKKDVLVKLIQLQNRGRISENSVMSQRAQTATTSTSASYATFNNQSNDMRKRPSRVCIPLLKLK